MTRSFPKGPALPRARANRPPRLYTQLNLRFRLYEGLQSPRVPRKGGSEAIPPSSLYGARVLRRLPARHAEPSLAPLHRPRVFGAVVAAAGGSDPLADGGGRR